MSSSLECGSGSSASRLPLTALALLGLCAAAAWGGAGKSATRPAATQPAAYRVTGDRFETPDGWFRLPDVERPALPAEVTKAFVIPIHGPITNTTFKAVQRKVIRCKTAGAQLVVFDMDTPGGRTDAMKAITEQILDELPGVTTVAYVNREAYSAGAVISLACHEIAMAPRAIIGDAMPILIGPQGQLVPLPKAERAKIESYVLAEVRLLAQARGHNESLCEAMVTLGMELWLIRNVKTRELNVVEAEKWRGKLAGAPGEDTAGLFGTEETAWEYVRRIHREDKLLTLTTDEALSAGLARYVFKDTDALKEHYNVVGDLVTLEDNWSEDVVAFLTSQAMMAFLIFVGILCAYVEINSPGFGIAGAVAILCFAIVFGSQYLSGMAQFWEIALFFVGVVLLVVEVLIIPGFGVAGIAGILCCFAALLAMLVANAPTEIPWPNTEGAWAMFTTGTLWLLAAFVGAVVVGVVLGRYMHRVPLAGRLVLAAPDAPDTAPTSEAAPIRHIRRGQVGKVTQTCRPVGKVEIDGEFLDAIAEGVFVKAGSEVVVLRVEGNRVVVEAKT